MNHEGYRDPTADRAMSVIEREKAIEAARREEMIAEKNHMLMKSIRCIVELAGFEIVGRITLKHKRSGKVFK